MTGRASAWCAFALLLALGGCGSSNSSSTEEIDYSDYSGDEASTDEDSTAEFDETRAREDAEQEVADEGYTGSCTYDCSGHDAGFTWAADGHVDGGVSSSQSFDEGQEAYEEAVEERVEAKRQEFEDEGADSDYAY